MLTLNKKSILVLLLVAISSVISWDIRLTTYDEDFEDKWQVEHLTRGDDKTYPYPNKYLKMKFKGFVPSTGQVFDSTDMRGGVYEIQFRGKLGYIETNVPHPLCFDQVYPRMSSGEKIVVICPAREAYGSQGLLTNEKQLVKPGETVAFEIEMLDAQWDPFELKIINPGVGKVKPRYMDQIRYKYDVWVARDSEFVFLAGEDSASIDSVGSTFDIPGETPCLTAAIRELSVGGVAEVYCPERYRSRRTFGIYSIDYNVDLSYRVTLVSLRESKWHTNHDSRDGFYNYQDPNGKSHLSEEL